MYFFSCRVCLLVSDIWLAIVIYNRVFTILWLVSYPNAIYQYTKSVECIRMCVHMYVCMYETHRATKDSV